MGARRIIPALAALALLVPAAGARADGTSLKRAVASYHTLQHYYYLRDHKLYRGEPFTHAWPFSQALAATIRMSELPSLGGRYEGEVRDRLLGLDRYWDPSSDPPGYTGGVQPPLGRGGTKYYDDNEWIGIELLRRYRKTHATALLNRAEQLFDLVVYGWDTDQTHACPGGVVFSQSPSNFDRNTITNAPGTQLGAELYRLTHNGRYLDWAKRFYDWVQTCLRNQRGLYIDHIRFGGGLDHTLWSYNQGVMVGANVLLYRATGDAAYLRHAKRGARAALAWFSQSRLRRQPAIFVAIFFENLMALDALRGNSRIRAAAASWADWAWRKHRNKRTNGFAFPVHDEHVLDQAAVVRAYVMLARSR